MSRQTNDLRAKVKMYREEAQSLRYIVAELTGELKTIRRERDFYRGRAESHIDMLCGEKKGVK